MLAVTSTQRTAQHTDRAPTPRRVPDAAAAEAYALDQRAKQLSRVARRAIVELGEVFAAVEQRALYRTLGYESFEAWLAQPELGYSRTQVYRLMRIAAATASGGAGPRPSASGAAPPATPLLDRATVAELGIAKADVLVGALRQERDPEAAAELIAQARTLSLGDFRLAVRERQGAPLTAQQEYVAQLQAGLYDRVRALGEHPQPSVVLADIEQRCQRARAWLAALAREGGHGRAQLAPERSE